MLENNDLLEFKYNGFVVKRHKNGWAVDDTDYIIPYYAIKGISECSNDCVEVELKSQLSAKHSFDKVLYQIDSEKTFKIKFSNEYEKQLFVNNIEKYIEDEKLDIVFN